MWKIRITAGYSKKRCAWANFLSHAWSTHDNTDKIFKGFDTGSPLLFQIKFYRKDLVDELEIFGLFSLPHLDDFMRGQIIGKFKKGRKATHVSREFNIAHSIVSRLCESFKTIGMCSRRHVGDHVRSTTPARERYIVLSTKKNWHTTA